MTSARRRALYVVVGAVGVILVVVGTGLLVIDASDYKPRVEAAASAVLGMPVSVGGRLRIGLLPGLRLTLEDVRVRGRDADVATAAKVRLGLGFLRLLQGEVSIETMNMNAVTVSLQRDREGLFNFERPEGIGDARPPLELTTVSASGVTLLYTNLASGEGFEAVDCSLDVRDLRLAGGVRPALMKNVSMMAELSCATFRRGGFEGSDLKVAVVGKDGTFALEPVELRLFGAQGTGSMQIDVSDAVPHYRVRYALAQLRIDELFRSLSPRQPPVGHMNFRADVSMAGTTVRVMKGTLQGDVSLRGENLTLNGIDLDRELAQFESSQSFNLVDVGAFFVAGPFGVVLTKGYNFASIFQGTGGSSEIRTLVSEWKIEDGIARARDVALATKENRIALRGGLDFVNEQFDGVMVALIDADGCSIVRQRIRGPFQKPEVERPNILRTITGPALGLLKKGRDLLSDEECEAFYVGSVGPPQ